MVRPTAEEIAAARAAYSEALTERGRYLSRVALTLWIHGNAFVEQQSLERATENLEACRARLDDLLSRSGILVQPRKPVPRHSARPLD